MHAFANLCTHSEKKKSLMRFCFVARQCRTCKALMTVPEIGVFLRKMPALGSMHAFLCHAFGVLSILFMRLAHSLIDLLEFRFAMRSNKSLVSSFD